MNWMQRYIRCDFPQTCSEIRDKIPTDLLEVRLGNSSKSFTMTLDAKRLLQDAQYVKNDGNANGCYFTLISDSYAQSNIHDKWVFGAIAM